MQDKRSHGDVFRQGYAPGRRNRHGEQGQKMEARKIYLYKPVVRSFYRVSELNPVDGENRIRRQIG